MSITTNGLLPLPLEILQTILLLLDFESFHLTSRSCRLWRNAALGTAILRRQLLSAPALAKSAGLIRGATAKEIRVLYRRVCRDNLIGIRCGIEYRETTRSKDRSTRISDIPVRSAHGVQSSAQLRGLTLTFDPPSSSALSLTSTCKIREIQLSPTLYPSADTIKQITSHAHAHARSFFRARPFVRIQVAVSRCGGLVAVALGQKLHIYAAQAQLGKKQQQHIEVEVSENVLDSIQSVEFTDDDALIRCEIDGVEGSYVRFLGHLRCRCNHRPEAKPRESRLVITPAQRLRYWRIALQNVYLDSAQVEAQLGGGVSVRGMRAVSIRPLGKEQACMCRPEKYFCALLREGSCEGRYVLGRVVSGEEEEENDGGVEIVQRILTRRWVGYLPETLDPITLSASPPRLGMSIDRWDTRNLPRAHSLEPILKTSDDGKILAVFEPPHGQSERMIYICAADYDSLYGDNTAPCVAWPFALCGLDHELDALDVRKDEKAGGYIVTAQSQEKLMEWSLGRTDLVGTT